MGVNILRFCRGKSLISFLRCGRRKTCSCAVILSSVGVVLTLMNVYNLGDSQPARHGREVQATTKESLTTTKESLTTTKDVKDVQHNRKKPVASSMTDVMAVFKNIGYELQMSRPPQWDVLWSHQYPFPDLQLANLAKHQKVNHFPGTFSITMKDNLVTSKGIETIPKAFILPEQLADFIRTSKEHPDWLWVHKSNEHRGVQIKKMIDINITATGSFVQQYVGDPFLIDGKRFDIGVYTAITSFDPLRVYINEGDFTIRFCMKNYHPFDQEDTDKYVVTFPYLPLSKVPSLQLYHDRLGFNQKDSLFAYLHSQGHDVDLLMERIRESIRSVFIIKENRFRKAFYEQKFNKRNFFEMVRFDFLVDSQLNVYLMEVNMSPNLSSADHPHNQVLYQQTVFTLLKLVGVSKGTTGKADNRTAMEVHDRDIHVLGEVCASKKCLLNCAALECKICEECLNAQQIFDLKATYLEHQSRDRWRRVLPRPFQDHMSAAKWNYSSDEHFQRLNTENKLLALWFHGKCLRDSAWCQ